MKTGNLLRGLILFIVALALLAGCKTVKYVPVETRVTERIEIRDTVVQVQIEREAYKVTTRDTASLLETRYALSRAEWSGGVLTHYLANKEAATVAVPTKTVTREVVKHVPTPYEVEVIKEIEKTLTWWQKTQILLGRLFLVCLGATVAIFSVRRYVP